MLGASSRSNFDALHSAGLEIAAATACSDRATSRRAACVSRRRRCRGVAANGVAGVKPGTNSPVELVPRGRLRLRPAINVVRSDAHTRNIFDQAAADRERRHLHSRAPTAATRRPIPRPRPQSGMRAAAAAPSSRRGSRATQHTPPRRTRAGAGAPPPRTPVGGPRALSRGCGLSLNETPGGHIIHTARRRPRPAPRVPRQRLRACKAPLARRQSWRRSTTLHTCTSCFFTGLPICARHICVVRASQH